MNIKAILLMAGSGTRFNSPLPKQFHFLAGKKIYQHTLERFLASQLFAEIILVCPEAWLSQVQQEVHAPCVRVVPGGKTRQESSYLGLLACGPDTEIVLIHDAVRPFVSIEILKKNLELSKKYGAVDTCIPSADTLVHSDDLVKISSIPDRKTLLRGQTPQTFSYPLILQAHQQARIQATDDCSLVLALAKPVHIVPGDESNMKITSDLDLYLAEQLFRRHICAHTNKTTLSLKENVFVLTGGTGAIGRALARKLESEGAHTLLLSRNSTTHPVDLTSQEATQEVFQKIGKIDGLINCIGKFHRQPLDKLSFQDIEELLSTNLHAVIFACKAAQFNENGVILNIASSSYSRGRENSSIYSAAKAAVVNFTQALAEERSDLRVHALAPQRTDSPMRRMYFPEEDPNELLSIDTIADQALSLLKEESTGMLVDVRRDR